MDGSQRPQPAVTSEADGGQSTPLDQVVGVSRWRDGRIRGSPPPVPSLAIRRPRLEQLLDAHLDRQVVLVRGPVGAGKTVLVTQWVSQHSTPVAWLSLDAGHDDADRLRWSVIEALEQLSQDATGPVVTGSLDRDRTDDAVLWDLLELVSNELRTRITLVFDEIDRLREEASHHVIRQLVERPQEAVRVVLISRSKPPLGLERARLRGDLVEVLPTALRFDRAEIEALIAAWDGRHPGVAELEQVTLGWAAGLRLAQLDAAADASSTLLNESGGLVAEYVREEILDAVPEPLWSFLEMTCWLPLMTEALRRATTTLTGGRHPLTACDLEALPILPVASHPGAFRYPPILADAVQQEITRRDPTAASDARRRAADACRRSGEQLTAIELLLDEGDADAAADVCADLAARGEPSLGALDELLHRRPDVAPSSSRWIPWRIRAAVAAGHVDEGRRLLERLDPLPVSIDSLDGGGRDLVIARAAVAERVGDAPVLLTCADRLAALPEELRADPFTARDAHGWRVRALVWLGDLERARAALRAFEQGFIDPVPATAVEIALARGWVAWLGGDIAGLSDSMTACGAAGDGSRDLEQALLAACVHRERGQLGKAQPLARQARALATELSHEVIDALAACELAQCHLVAGAVMDALELVAPTRGARPGLPAAIDARLRDTEVRAWLKRGDVDSARAALRAAPPGVDTQLTRARLALRDTPNRAHELLEAIDAQTPRQAVEKLLLHAQLPDIADDDASAALVAAISAGGHLGLVRTFLDEGPDMSRRLEQLALESPDRTLGRLGALVSQELALAPTRGATEPVEPLTPRELAVLRLLPLRLSNREMATHMYVSHNTMKTHIRAIYRKLDVPHRSAAVRRAKALQLL